jgi:hypothetical protein
MLAAAMLAAAAAVPAADRAALVERTVFDTCPRVFAGTLSLADPAALAPTGFAATAPRTVEGGTVPRAEQGAGAAKLVIAGQPRTCSVWFGGPDNKALLKSMTKRARRDGYVRTPPARLGDGTAIWQLIRATPAQTVVVIEADAGGEFGGSPATTFIYMDK